MNKRTQLSGALACMALVGGVGYGFSVLKERGDKIRAAEATAVALVKSDELFGKLDYARICKQPAFASNHFYRTKLGGWISVMDTHCGNNAGYVTLQTEIGDDKRTVYVSAHDGQRPGTGMINSYRRYYRLNRPFA